jgi:hypothetical protein
MDIILHTSGLSRSKESYRNRYVTQEDDPDLLALKEKGLMDGRHVTITAEKLRDKWFEELSEDKVKGYIISCFPKIFKG